MAKNIETKLVTIGNYLKLEDVVIGNYINKIGNKILLEFKINT